MLFYTLNLNETQKSKFERLYIQYRSLVFYLAYEKLEDEMESENVVHDVFMKALRCLDNIDIEQVEKTRAFLVTITRNHCINMLKKRPKEQHISWDELEDWQKPYEDADLFAALPEENQVLTIIEHMPPLYKEILLLKYVNELDDAVIASLLGIKEESVRKRIYRGKKLLKKELDEVK